MIRLLRLTINNIAIALLSMTIAFNALAQNAQKLSLPELEALMLSQSPALRGAASATAVAAAAVDTARTIPNPQVEVINGTRKPRLENPNGTNGNVKSISITQDLDMPWHRFPRIDGAIAGYNAAQADERAFTSDMLTQLRLRYYDLVRRVAENRAMREDVLLMEGMQKRIVLQVETGEKAKFELVKANAELLNAQKMHESTVLRVRQARGALRALVGIQIPENFEVPETPHVFAPPAPLTEVRDEVMKNNPNCNAHAHSVNSLIEN